MKALINAIIATLVATPAFAATGFEDHSGLLCWAFLGLCAMIVVGQLIPAVMMLLGAAKGVMKPNEAKEHHA
ncbi:hypothetical protein [Geomesophilobacter sediminis]|uniref:Uncharacterized protein n=1 Tax=Geomesophilobacter sediminis TaxID=2798584 RepID=A0A8J7M3L3_9BACT|nr:hypothetical protein [Geomesophilobacter sediminis]MBJ6726814.1 hypothetical protein [Geomesophilobacter sediminis]MBJ6728018.1 hypothetical protein [Geomesophilobacter sediminis]